MKAAQPFMLIVVQIGRTKRETVGFTLRFFSAEANVTGKVPAELFVKSATATAGAILRKTWSAAEDDSRVLAERANDDTSLDLCRKLRGKGEDTDGQNVEQRADQREKKLLCAMERLQQHGTILRLGHEGERQPDSCRNQHD